MKTIYIVLALMMFPLVSSGQFLNDYQWKSRLVLLFTPEPTDPLYERQMALLYRQQEAFEERNVVFISITPEGKHENSGVFLDEAMSRKYYDHFGVYQYQFEMILVGLDSHEKFRAKNTITPPSILLNLIDEMPMRRLEIRRGLSNKSQIANDDNGKGGGRRQY